MFVGQSIPAECMDQDVDVLDASGRVVRKIPGRGRWTHWRRRRRRKTPRPRRPSATVRCSRRT